MTSSANANDSPRRPRLKVGLLVDSFDQPAWVASLIDDITSSDVASVALVVRNAAPSEAPPRRTLGARARQWIRNRHLLLYALYERIDARKFGEPNDPLANVDVAQRLDGVPVIDVVPRMTKFSDYFSDEDVERIRGHELDVALRLGFRILRGKALDIARYGVWSYHHGDNLVNRGGPPGFWEVMEGHATTGSVLQVLSEELDAGRVIYRSLARTSPLSVTKNRAGYFWKSSTFVVRKLRELYDDGGAALVESPPARVTSQPVAYSQRLYLTPRNRELAPHLTRLATRYARAKLVDLTSVDQWVLAFRFGPASAGSVPDLSPFRFHAIVPPPDRFWADPFPLRVDGRSYVLFEELVFKAPKGRILGMELTREGPAGPPVPVLERDYHLSYPYTFEWRGDRFMIPESVGNRSVQLFRGVTPPYEWELDRVLLSDVQLLDATVVEIDGRWWMFAGSVTRGGSRCDELNVYYADTPLGPWQPHRRNPVVSDVRHARPAGRPFQVGGSWYRPAQDCSRRYGYAIALRRIVRLTPNEFEEETVTSLTPHWDRRLLGTHTLNAVDGLTVIDMEIRRRRPLLQR
jgi:hypothetical protein